ncbi:hypothetical protein ABZP36_002303 [Zizania latifolia]
MPTRSSFSSMGTERDAGPSVRTSLVFGTRVSPAPRSSSAGIVAMSVFAIAPFLPGFLLLLRWSRLAAPRGAGWLYALWMVELQQAELENMSVPAKQFLRQVPPSLGNRFQVISRMNCVLQMR